MLGTIIDVVKPISGLLFMIERLESHLILFTMANSKENNFTMDHFCAIFIFFECLHIFSLYVLVSQFQVLKVLKFVMLSENYFGMGR